jgi:hypothetical protein
MSLGQDIPVLEHGIPPHSARPQIRAPYPDQGRRLPIKSGPQQVTLEPVPSRAQLAVALILLLVLAPAAGTICGIRCLAATPQMHAVISQAISQEPCVRPSACCHSSGPAVCSRTQAPEAVATLPSTGRNVPSDPPASAVIAAGILPQNSRTRAAQTLDSSPPGQPRTARLIPLRI